VGVFYASLKICCLGRAMKKILVNTHPWETRVALLQGNLLQNVYLSSHTVESLERCFFKGIVTKILPGIQTAFVDIGREKAGFLHISEIDYELAFSRMADSVELEDGATEEKKEPTSRRDIDISKVFKEGESILVQVSKEPVYEKGAKLTTSFTLPGRFIVLMPNIPRIGISKRIESREERVRLKEIVQSLLPEGMGAIIRTSSETKNPVEISKDVTYLLNTWKTIQSNFKKAQNKEKIYEELPLSHQVVRDNLDDNTEQILVDTQKEQQSITNFIKAVAPEFAHCVSLCQEQPDLFARYNIEKQIEDALARKVYLKSGGSIIVETTEAMAVVDVNTGKYIGKSNLEDTILQTNLEAAREVVRQLRLRNIGGLIVIDFIDMASAAHRQKLFKFFEQELKEQDRFQSVVLKVSEFGLVQMTRKRSGKTLTQMLTQGCSSCRGLGFIKSTQTLSYLVLRKFQAELAEHKGVKSVMLMINPSQFDYITSIGYDIVLQLERMFGCKITLLSDKGVEVATYRLKIEN
jgi:ribonuclease G